MRRSAAESCTLALAFAVTPSGNEGWLSTGAITSGVAIMPRANPPVKHMPIAPTPGPPHSPWVYRARARSQSVIGARRPVANDANSFDTQAFEIERAM